MRRGTLVAPLVLGMCLLGGCVSTTTGTVKPEANENDAAEMNMALGAQYYQNGSYELARDRLLKALELNPRLGTAYSTLGMTYEALDNLRLATEAYENSVRVAPRDFHVRNAYAVFVCRQQAFDEAVKHFDKAVAHPENDNAHITLVNAGMCMLQGADTGKAETYFRSALDRKPGYGEALLQLCLLKFTQKEYLAARAFLQRYMSTNATTASVLFLASRIEDLLGNDSGRKDYENQLLRQFPTSPEARKVLSAG